jgi:hypothetical protein
LIYGDVAPSKAAMEAKRAAAYLLPLVLTGIPGIAVGGIKSSPQLSALAALVAVLAGITGQSDWLEALFDKLKPYLPKWLLRGTPTLAGVDISGQLAATPPLKATKEGTFASFLGSTFGGVTGDLFGSAVDAYITYGPDSRRFAFALTPRAAAGVAQAIAGRNKAGALYGSLEEPDPTILARVLKGASLTSTLEADLNELTAESIAINRSREAKQKRLRGLMTEVAVAKDNPLKSRSLRRKIATELSAWNRLTETRRAKYRIKPLTLRDIRAFDPDESRARNLQLLKMQEK